MRYIQASVTDEEYRKFRLFAVNNDLSLNNLVALALNTYIKTRKEAEQEALALPNTDSLEQ